VIKPIKIKKGWDEEGKLGTQIGKPVFVEQYWTPVVWDDEDDPTFFKTAGIEEVKEI
jgi:hypothetical protein